MTVPRLIPALALGLVVIGLLAVGLGETQFEAAGWQRALSQPGSAEAEILWGVRLPRVVLAALVGAALGLSGGLLQGLLRNPLADPGVLGVSAAAGLGAALAIVAGLALVPGAVELAAWFFALAAGLALFTVSIRRPEPETLILFGVALSAFAGALTALVFNLSPSPIATAEVLAWMMGSVESRSWLDVALMVPPLVVGLILARVSAPALRMLTLGEEVAAVSGLNLSRMRLMALAGATLATGAAVAVSGVIGFVGLAAPHLVRGAARDDPGRLLVPSALAGAVLLVLADLVARLSPTEVELKLGVVTALVGAPLFALIAWRAARSWRS